MQECDEGSKASGPSRGLGGVDWIPADESHAEGATFGCSGPYGGFHKACVKDGRLLPQDSLAEEWAGIHDSNPNSLFAKAERRGGLGARAAYTWASLPLREARRRLEKLGGHPPQRLAIPRPSCPIMASIGEAEGGSTELIEAVEAKSRELDRSYGHSPDRYRRLALMVDLDVGFHEERASFYAMAWTRVLEIWNESVIRSLPQALCYAVSMHEEWREVALAWLEVHRLTWVRSYQQYHFEAVRVARRHAAFGMLLPQWLTRSRLGLVPLYSPFAPGGGIIQHRATYEASYVHHRDVSEPRSEKVAGLGPRNVTIHPDGRITCGLDVMLEAGCIVGLGERTLCSADLLEAAEEVSGDRERPRVTMAISTSRRILEAHGGLRVASRHLPKRKRTVRDALPGKLRDPAQMEWVLHDSEVFAIAYEPDHWNRHDALLAYVGGGAYATDDGEGALRRALAITLVLDAWAEEHVEGLPAALAYAHSLIPGWRRPALGWLKPHRDVYLQQYMRDRPELAGLTREIGKVVTGLPRWLSHPEDGARRRGDAAWKRRLS